MPRPVFRIVRRRILTQIDWLLLLTTLALCGLGILTLWGARSSGDGLAPMDGIVQRQCLWVGLGSIGIVALIGLDYRLFIRLAPILYIALLIALAGLNIKGLVVKGAQSWYDLGLFRLQPSEPGKIVVVLMLARYLARRADTFRGLRHAPVPILIVAAPMVLIAAQPDLGTALVFAPIAAAMFWTAGMRKRIFFLFAILAVCLAAAGYPHLKPYQRERIRTFVSPDADARGKGYNINQAQAALGSGELVGKGLGRGTQTTYRFLPEYHTDFIFPTIGEQFGMVGCVVVLGLFVVLIGRMVRLAERTEDLFGVLTIMGLTTLLATHLIFNVGMSVGLLPVTGLPLPFFSYGGSFMLSSLAAVGLAVGIGARKER